jgi:hypothetical protein
MISEVSVADGLGVSKSAQLRPKYDELLLGAAARPAAFEPAMAGVPAAAQSGAPSALQPAAQTPKYLPSMLETSSSVVVMSDARGWITYASIGACQLLRDSCDQSLVTLLARPTKNAFAHPVGSMPPAKCRRDIATTDWRLSTNGSPCRSRPM